MRTSQRRRAAHPRGETSGADCTTLPSDHGETATTSLSISAARHDNAANGQFCNQRVKRMATIIRLYQFNVGCRHHANGIRFPHVYRVTGFEHELVDEGTDNARLVPGNTVTVEPFYTLSEIGDHGIANARIQPIKSL